MAMLSLRILCVLKVLATTYAFRMKARTNMTELTTGVAFTVRGTGDLRFDGDWQHAGWHRDRPKYAHIGDKKAKVEWSDSRMSWRMLYDDTMFGYGRKDSYLSSENTLTVPTGGWASKDGDASTPSIVKRALTDIHADGYFVFLAVYNILNIGDPFRGINPGALVEDSVDDASADSAIGAHHSEVHMCNLKMFTQAEREDLLTYKSHFDTFLQVSPDWWKTKSHAWCGVMSFTGSHGDCSTSCCAVGRDAIQLAKGDRGYFKDASKYFYGWTSKATTDEVYEEMCACGEKWTGKAYSFLTHNCNTFSSSVMSCSLGLSAAQPLGWSSMGKVTCCP